MTVIYMDSISVIAQLTRWNCYGINCKMLYIYLNNRAAIKLWCFWINFTSSVIYFAILSLHSLLKDRFWFLSYFHCKPSEMTHYITHKRHNIIFCEWKESVTGNIIYYRTTIITKLKTKLKLPTNKEEEKWQ